MEEKIKQIEKEIESIKARNSRVEGDKAWETSISRIISITIITYIIAVIVFYIIGVRNVFLNALVPTLGFFLSVQSLPILKKWWIKSYLRNDEKNN